MFGANVVVISGREDDDREHALPELNGESFTSDTPSFFFCAFVALKLEPWDHYWQHHRQDD